MDSIPVFLKPISNNISDSLIVCLGIDPSLILLDSRYTLEPFDDECVCVIRLLSITDKRVYFIVSSSIGENIIPLIYQHRCVEQIYIYCSDADQRNAVRINNFPKIRDCWTDHRILFTAVHNDIQLILSRSSLWSNIELLSRCHIQTLVTSLDSPFVPLDLFNIEKYSILNNQIHIVVFHCDNEAFFHMDSQRFHLSVFSDATKCVQNLERMNVRSVFFIISGEAKSIKRYVEKFTMLRQIYAMYLFVPFVDQLELDRTLSNYQEIGRLFDKLDFLLTCLTADIKFYLEQPLYIPIISTFNIQNNTKDKRKLDFTSNQEKFVAFQLFVNILREAPAALCRNQRLYDRCVTLTDKKLDGETALEILKTETNKIFDWFINVTFLSVIINSFLQEQFPQNILEIQQILRTIDQHFAKLVPTTSSVVYRVQFLREEDLQIIKANINELISFHTYIVAAKDLLVARTIARQAANRGLLAMILQIEIPAQTPVLDLDNNRVIFRFGAIFRIRSINSAPDGVWYAQLKYADLDFQTIEERLQLQVGQQLTWLTLGNYICVLNHFDEANYYYNYLINTLPKDHKALPSIYNNMGLMFAESGDNEQSLRCYNTAEKLLNIIPTNLDHAVQRVPVKTLSQSDDVVIAIDCSILYDKMAEIHLRQSEHKEALKYYRKALELATDPFSRVQLEQKIRNILSLVQS